MKKEYIEPKMQVVGIKLQSMICESLEADPSQNSPTMDSLDDVEFEED